MLQIFKNLIIKNTFWLLSANVVVKLITFGYTIILARFLGPNDYGLYIYALTIFGIVSATSDLGLGRFLIRELAKDTHKASFYLSNVAIISLTTAISLFLITAITIAIFDPQKIRSSLATVMILATLPNILILISQNVYTAFERMRLVAISMVSLSALVVVLGILVIFWQLSVFALVITFVISHLFILILNYFLIKSLNIKLIFDIDFAFWQQAIKRAIPYGVLTIIGLIYFRIDVVMLSFLKDNATTGYYGAAFRFLDGVHIIPYAVSTAIFPLMSRLHMSSIFELKRLYFKTIGSTFLLSIPITLILFFGAAFFIKLLYGSNYIPSIPALKILCLTIPFMFLHVPGAHLLFASDRFLGKVILISIVTVSFNIIGNFLLIPPLGLIGASITTVLSEIISFGVFFLLIYYQVFRKF